MSSLVISRHAVRSADLAVAGIIERELSSRSCLRVRSRGRWVTTSSAGILLRLSFRNSENSAR